MNTSYTIEIVKKDGTKKTFPLGTIAAFQFTDKGFLFIREVEKRERTKKQIISETRDHWFKYENIESVTAKVVHSANGKDEVEYYEEFHAEGIDLFETNLDEMFMNLNQPTQEQIEAEIRDFEARKKEQENGGKKHES